MKREDIKKLSTKSSAELSKMVVELEKEIVDLRMQKAINKLTNPRLYEGKRQDLARIKTILTEKTSNSTQLEAKTKNL